MRVILLMIIMIIAVSASVLVLKFSNQAAPQPQVVQVQQPQPEALRIETVDVLVARQEIPVGTVIQDHMIDRQPWPSHLVLQGFVTTTSPEAAMLVGMVSRSAFQAREPLIAGKLAKPNDPSFLAAALPEGMRAVTIAVDAVSAVAGYIFPGDRVDVILTHSLLQAQSQNSGGGQPSVAEVLVANAKVIGTNMRGSDMQAQAQGQVQVPSSVSLEVTEADAQKIRLAEKLGTLSLTLRSLKDMQKADPSSPTTLNELSQATMPRSMGGGVNIIRGAGNQAAGGGAGAAPAPAMPSLPFAAGGR